MSRSRKRPRMEAPEPVSTGLEALAARHGWATRLEGARVHQVWPEIVGEDLARHVEVVRLHGGVLVVRCSSGAWASQVRWMAGDIITRANEVLGAGQVTAVQVASGSTGQPGRSR